MGPERGGPGAAGPAGGEAQALIAAAAQLEVPLSAVQAQALLRLLDELAEWNRAYNLTAIRDRAAMVQRHLLDSLSAAAELCGTRIADVGTGAGFPGLPLAVVAPERHFTLIDSVQKKMRFVAHAARLLALDNVTAVAARVETFVPPVPFDTVIARAFAPLPRLLAAVARLVGPGTRVVALKGRYPAEELAQLPPAWRVAACREVHIPGLDAQRHILSLVPVADLRG